MLNGYLVTPPSILFVSPGVVPMVLRRMFILSGVSGTTKVNPRLSHSSLLSVQFFVALSTTRKQNWAAGESTNPASTGHQSTINKYDDLYKVLSKPLKTIHT